jgi:allantoinase
MSRVDLVIRGSVLTDASIRPRTVGIADGIVVTIGDVDADLAADAVVLLADDEVLIPGLVDTHVHVNEPGRTEWEGFETATRAAAAGGVTTILDMPLNSIPPTIDPAALAIKRRAAAGQCHVDVGFWAGAVPSSLGGLRRLHDEGVFGFKCFLLDSGVAEFAPLLGDQLDAAMAEIAAFDGLLLVHAEDDAAIQSAPHEAGRDYRTFLASRPPESENVAVAQVIEAARRTGARVHIVHLSSAEAIPQLRAARADGVRVTVETCPHYLTLSANDIGAGQTQFKCCPPIRDQANQDALWAALREGVIDFVVSDHSPSTAALKLPDTGDFGAAWGGISSLQLGLPLVWTQARRRGYDLSDVVTWMSRRTSDIVGVAGKGRIAVGAAADVVVFAPDDSFVVQLADLQHRNPVCPYVGAELTGVVRDTFLRGTPVTGTDPHGAIIERL